MYEFGTKIAMSLHMVSFGHGKPIVLFHGWGFDHKVFLDLASEMQDRYTLFLIDLPGFGKSPHMSWESFKIKLLELIPTSFALLGWSMGGLWATRFAMEEPQAVTHLINVASSPYFMQEKDWPGMEAKVLDEFSKSLLEDPAALIKKFVASLASRYLRTVGPVFSSDQVQGLEAGIAYLLNWDLRKGLHSLQCPASYILGENDTIVPKSLHQVIRSQYAHCHSILFEKAAHVPFLSHKKRFIQEVEAFLHRTSK